jgi:hypothetical protein
MLVPPLVAALLGALLLMHWQKPSYQATSEVMASRAGGVPMRAQALLARSPELAARVVAAAGVPGMSPGKLLAASVVIPAADSDLLRFSISDAHSRDAMAVAAAALTSSSSPLSTAHGPVVFVVAAADFLENPASAGVRTHQLARSQRDA